MIIDILHRAKATVVVVSEEDRVETIASCEVQLDTDVLRFQQFYCRYVTVERIPIVDDHRTVEKGRPWGSVQLATMLKFDSENYMDASTAFGGPVTQDCSYLMYVLLLHRCRLTYLRDVFFSPKFSMAYMTRVGVHLELLEQECQLLNSGITLEMYSYTESRSLGQWSLHLKDLSLEATITALLTWINDLSCSLDSLDRLSTLLGINPGNGQTKDQVSAMTDIYYSTTGPKSVIDYSDRTVKTYNGGHSREIYPVY